MLRIIGFLILVALLALGAAWIAEQSGDLILTAGHWRIETTLPVAVLGFGIALASCIFVWWLLRGLLRTPQSVRAKRRARRLARARNAITHGLIAIGHGDAAGARSNAALARRLSGDDPLALLLVAQSAQLDGDRAAATRAFRAMTDRPDTLLLGLRGLFIEAQRADDPVSAYQIAEEALRSSPGVGWASQAVLGLRCAHRDWDGALGIIERDAQVGATDRKTYRRRRAVLLTARALELEGSDRDRSRSSIMEAVKLAPTLVPAAVLAARFESEAQQTRRAMRLLEAAWVANPHPDIADAYAHVKLGDSARQRLVRIEALAAKAPDHPESRLAVARAAIDAQEFTLARAALAPLLAAPTQRVCMLMAEIERVANSDEGRSRAWTQAAVRALHDPAWTADGYVSDRWHPISPVTGRLDAFHWQTPVASLPGERIVDVTLANEQPVSQLPGPADSPPPVDEIAAEPAPAEPAAETAAPSDSAPDQLAAGSDDNSEIATQPAEPPTPPPAASPPLFRHRPVNGTGAAPAAVIPILRAPDDPGTEPSATASDEFGEMLAQQRPGGWRGFVRRLKG
jgi:HemY protein